MSNDRPRTKTLTGFSVKDQLDLWKKRDAAQNSVTTDVKPKGQPNIDKSQTDVTNYYYFMYVTDILTVIT